MSKGVVAALELVAAAVILYASGGTLWQVSASLVLASGATAVQARAEIKAKNAYNASLVDRYTVTRSTLAARQLVFGRCRVSGPLFFISSYGTDDQHLVMCIALAAHEVDAIEAVYFDDQQVALDGSGNVVGIRIHESFSIAASTETVSVQQIPVTGSVTAQARYGEDIVGLTVTSVSVHNVSVSGARAGQVGQLDIFYQSTTDKFAPTRRTQHVDTFTITSSGQTFTLTNVPDATGVTGVYQATSGDANDNTPITIASVIGSNVTISGGSIGRHAVFYYDTSSVGTSLARVRTYTGAPGQVADATLIANLPGVWTSAHTATGIAYVIVECDYDDTAFQGGMPNVSAVVRGMKCYDPRNGTTAWTENPALHARALAAHPLAGNLPASAIDDDAISEAANVCDTPTTYTVGTADYTRALYTSGYACTVDQKPSDCLTDIVQAMGAGAGWVYADGKLRVVAGSYRSPVPLTIDETFLVDDAPVQIQVGVARASLVNTITASIADQFQDYKVVPLPRLSPDDYTADDGATLSQDITFAAITFTGQAQYAASCMLRQARQGLSVSLRCNLRAWQLERFDNVQVSLDRFGWDAKVFEVMSDTWTADGAIDLLLRETTPEIWDMDAGFPDYDLAPNTDLPLPWGIAEIASLVATSDGTTAQVNPDGTVIPRIKLTWATITDSRVLQGGYIEVRYWLLGDTTDNYATARVFATETTAFIGPIRAGAQYLVTARACSAIAQSPWCPATLTNSGGRTTAPANVTGAAYSEGSGRVHFTWTADTTDPDYKLTEVRIGTTWAGGAKVAAVAGVAADWIPSTLGSYTAWFAHQNFSGVYSASPASLAVTVDSSLYGSGGGGAQGPVLHATGAITPQTHTAVAAIRFDSTGTISRKQGDNATATYSALGGGIRWFTGTPAGTEQIQFDLVVQNGAGTVGGTGGGALNLSASPAVTMTVLNGAGTATILYTITDASGNTLATGFIFLSVESSP